MLDKDSILNVLKNIFHIRGYVVKNVSDSDFIAEKDNEKIFVLYAQQPEDVLAVETDLDANRKLAIFDWDDSRIAKLAYESGFDLWDRTQLEQEIGRTVLEACETTLNYGLSELYEKEISDKNKGIRVNLPGATPRLSETEAINIAVTKGFNLVAVKLLFIPHWKYTYKLHVQKKFKNRNIVMEDRGTSMLNALTGEKNTDEVPEISDFVSSPTENYEIREPLVTQEEAYSLILKQIIDKNKKEIRINELIGDTIVFEQKTFSPEPGDIMLSLDLICLPVWHISGKENQSIDLDAVTKKQINATYTEEDVEFIP